MQRIARAAPVLLAIQTMAFAYASVLAAIGSDWWQVFLGVWWGGTWAATFWTLRNRQPGNRLRAWLVETSASFDGLIFLFVVQMTVDSPSFGSIVLVVFSAAAVATLICVLLADTAR